MRNRYLVSAVAILVVFAAIALWNPSDHGTLILVAAVAICALLPDAIRLVARRVRPD